MGNRQTPLQTTKLFVYGSLMPGEWNHSLIENSVIESHDGTIEGVLVGLGMIPALVPGRGIVRDIMLEIAEAALVITDRLEGHYPDRAFYRRKRVSVQLENGQIVEAWAYFYARPEAVQQNPRLVTEWIDGLPIHEWTSRQ